MRVITTGSRTATDGTGRTFRTVTMNPHPDATPGDFVRQLRNSSVLADGRLVAIEPQGSHVVVVLTDFAGTRQALRAAGQLPRFSFLLPEN